METEILVHGEGLFIAGWLLVAILLSSFVIKDKL